MTFLAPARLGELLCNATLALTTAARHLIDDPLFFVLQVVRRLPPRVRDGLGGVLLGGGKANSIRRAVGFWVLDRPVEAKAALIQLKSGSAPHGRSRIRAELSVQLGCADIAGDLEDFPAAKVRALWQHGDLTAAVHVAGRQRSTAALAARLASEVRVMTPGDYTGSPHVEPTGGTERSSRTSVFHVLTNSLPYTQSGYAHRSHSVLMAQHKAGLRVAATTRLGYPVSIGRLAARHTDVIDGITYHRLIAPIADRTAEERIEQGVDKLVPLARDFGADVLHATTNFMNGLVARSAAQRLGLPWVYEVRGLLEETWVASRPAGTEQLRAASSEKYGILRARETEIAHAADHVFTLSETLRSELVQRGIPEAKITIVPNAVDERLLATALSSQAARRTLGIDQHGFWVGTVSSLVDYEGLDTLLCAIADLRRRHIDARGLIVGDGVSRPGLETCARALGIDDAVTFTGRVPRAATARHYQALDVFVVPRRDLRVGRLVTPLKPVEAMACARPVVASDLPALAELVTAPGSGRVFPPGDAIALANVLEELHMDEVARQALAEGGRAFASTRTWDSVGRTYREALLAAELPKAPR